MQQLPPFQTQGTEHPLAPNPEPVPEAWGLVPVLPRPRCATPAAFPRRWPCLPFRDSRRQSVEGPVLTPLSPAGNLLP